MTVVKEIWSGNPQMVSYRWVDFTPQDVINAQNASDQAAWVERNATIIETITI